jgi:tetratricopeptide (TPR) repeat protein
MRAFRVARPTPLAAGEPASEAPLVGRARELAQLEDAFERAARGEGQVVFPVGEAGIGKSRLLAELRRRLAGRPHQWVEGPCTSYGSASAFLPIVDALRRAFDIDDRDNEAAAAAKVDAGVALFRDEMAWTRPLLRRLLALPSGDDRVHALDAASRRSETFRALRALALRAALDQPLVIVVEDLHWIDPASEECLAFLADAVPTARVLLVCSHRPGYRHPFGDHSYHLRVSVQPLSQADMASMAGWLLGASHLPDALHRLITHKAEGNPFFVEEVTRSLLEQGVLRRVGDAIQLGTDVGAVAVPDSIHEVLSARIDRLPDQSRQAIQVASVIGREFALRLLERIAEAPDEMRDRVDELRALELVYQKALHPELAYMFKHALTHEVAYASVQPARRRALHRVIGVSIEELYADRLAEHWETLAHHFSAAEDWARALHYHELAAEKAEASHASRAVVEHCREALAIAERREVAAPAEQVVRLADRLGRACFYLSDYAASAAAHEVAAARATDAETRAFQLGHACLAHFWAHHYPDAERAGAETLRLGLECGSATAEAVGLVLDGMARGIHGDVAAMERGSGEALTVLTRAPDEQVEGMAKYSLMMAAEWTGRYQRAIELAERVLDIGTRHGLLHMVIWPLWFEGKALCCLGEYGTALEKLQSGYEFCDRIGDRAWKSRMLNTLGWCLAEIGSHERAREANLRASTLAHDIGDPEIIANSEINLALNALALGDPGRADAHLAPIEDTLARPGDPWMRWRYGLHVRDARARLLLAAGEPEPALALAEAERTDAQVHGVPKAEARALVVCGRALLAADRRDDAHRALDDAVGLATDIRYPRALLDAQLVLAALARRTGDGEHATRAAAAAADVVARLGATLADADLRRTFEATLRR